MPPGPLYPVSYDPSSGSLLDKSEFSGGVTIVWNYTANNNNLNLKNTNSGLGQSVGAMTQFFAVPTTQLDKISNTYNNYTLPCTANLIQVTQTLDNNNGNNGQQQQAQTVQQIQAVNVKILFDQFAPDNYLHGILCVTLEWQNGAVFDSNGAQSISSNILQNGVSSNTAITTTTTAAVGSVQNLGQNANTTSESTSISNSDLAMPANDNVITSKFSICIRDWRPPRIMQISTKPNMPYSQDIVSTQYQTMGTLLDIGSENYYLKITFSEPILVVPTKMIHCRCYIEEVDTTQTIVISNNNQGITTSPSDDSDGSQSLSQQTQSNSGSGKLCFTGDPTNFVNANSGNQNQNPNSKFTNEDAAWQSFELRKIYEFDSSNTLLIGPFKIVEIQPRNRKKRNLLQEEELQISQIKDLSDNDSNLRQGPNTIRSLQQQQQSSSSQSETGIVQRFVYRFTLDSAAVQDTKGNFWTSSDTKSGYTKLLNWEVRLATEVLGRENSNINLNGLGSIISNNQQYIGSSDNDVPLGLPSYALFYVIMVLCGLVLLLTAVLLMLKTISMFKRADKSELEDEEAQWRRRKEYHQQQSLQSNMSSQSLGQTQSNFGRTGTVSFGNLGTPIDSSPLSRTIGHGSSASMTATMNFHKRGSNTGSLSFQKGGSVGGNSKFAQVFHGVADTLFTYVTGREVPSMASMQRNPNTSPDSSPGPSPGSRRLLHEKMFQKSQSQSNNNNQYFTKVEEFKLDSEMESGVQSNKTQSRTSRFLRGKFSSDNDSKTQDSATNRSKSAPGFGNRFRPFSTDSVNVDDLFDEYNSDSPGPSPGSSPGQGTQRNHNRNKGQQAKQKQSSASRKSQSASDSSNHHQYKHSSANSDDFENTQQRQQHEQQQRQKMHQNQEISRNPEKFWPEGCEKECKEIDAVLNLDANKQLAIGEKEKMFKKLTFKHHPDKGGKKEVFQYLQQRKAGFLNS